MSGEAKKRKFAGKGKAKKEDNYNGVITPGTLKKILLKCKIMGGISKKYLLLYSYSPC